MDTFGLFATIAMPPLIIDTRNLELARRFRAPEVKQALH
jgi:hypothetical protein